MINGEYLNLRKGEYIMASTGDYSDYYVTGIFVVLKDFNVIEALFNIGLPDSSLRAIDKDWYWKHDNLWHLLAKHDYVQEVAHKQLTLEELHDSIKREWHRRVTLL